MNTTETYTIVLETKADPKSLKAYKEELKNVDLAMRQAAAAGDTAAYNKLAAKFGELKNDARDFGEAMKYADPGEFLAGVGKLAQGVAGAFSGISAGVKLIAGDNKALNEAMGKTAAAIQLIQGLESARQLIESKGVAQGLAGQVKRIGLYITESLTIQATTNSTKVATLAQKAWNVAVAANPIVLLIAAVAALAVAVYSLSNKFDENAFVIEQWNKRARKNIDNLKDSTKAYVDLVTNFNKSIQAFNDRNLTDGEKAKKQYLLQAATQRGIIKDMLVQLQYKAMLIAAEIKQGEAAMAWMQFLPNFNSLAAKGIQDQKDELVKLNETITTASSEYKIWNSKIDETANYIAKTTDEINRLTEAEKNAKKIIVEENVELTKMTPLLQKALYGENPEKIIEDFDNYLDEGIKSLGDRSEEFKMPETIGEKGLLWMTLFGSDQPDEARKAAAEEIEKRITMFSDSINTMSNLSNAAMENELAAAGDNEKRKEEIRKKYGPIRKASAIGQTIANGAMAVLNLWAGPSIMPSPFKEIYNGVMSASIAATTALQVATIKKQEFASGGLVLGPGTGTSDSINAKLSNGEGVLTAKSMAIPAFRSLASAINVAGGGVPFVNSSNASIIDYDLLASKLNDKKVYVTETDITAKQKKVSVIEQRAILG